MTGPVDDLLRDLLDLADVAAALDTDGVWPLADGTLDDLARRYDRLNREILPALGKVRSLLETEIAERMEADDMAADAGRLRLTRKARTSGGGWDNDGVRAAAKRAIPNLVAVRSTGEIDEDGHRWAEQTMEVVSQAFNLSGAAVNMKGARAVGLASIQGFRRFGEHSGWSVTVEPIAPTTETR